jgi:hypothetical protein
VACLGASARRLLAGPAIVALVAMGLGLAAPSGALADAGGIKLALMPIGQAGSFFDVTLAAGQTQTLSVVIANDGSATIAASTYVADVYTIIDGGFGARLHGQAHTGTTTWIAYPAATLKLAPGQSIRRSFTVAVPAGAAPGEYISSLLLENAEPIAAGAAVGINQVVRQAVAVVITVPGPRTPGLAIGEATDEVTNGTSTISVAVENTGNVRLKPIVGFTLTDATGAAISQATMQMDTFYAQTNTTVEFPLDVPLAPGRYSVALTLADAGQGSQVAASRFIVVGGPAVSVTPVGGSGGTTSTGPAGPGQSLPTAGLLTVTGSLLALGAASAAFVLRRRRAVEPG